jgi:hypothetical protein
LAPFSFKQEGYFFFVTCYRLRVLGLDDVYIYTHKGVGKKEKIEGGDMAGRIDPSSRSPHPVQYTWMDRCNWRSWEKIFVFKKKKFPSIADNTGLVIIIIIIIIRVCLPVTRWEVEYSQVGGIKKWASSAHTDF